MPQVRAQREGKKNDLLVLMSLEIISQLSLMEPFPLPHLCCHESFWFPPLGSSEILSLPKEMPVISA